MPNKVDPRKAIEHLSALEGPLALDGPEGELIKGLVYDYEKSQFEAVWSIMMKLKEADPGRGTLLQLMLSKMVAEGDSDSITRALAVVDGSFGPGQKANKLIWNIFGGAKPTSGVIQAAVGFKDPQERRMAFVGITNQLKYLQDLSQIDLRAMKGISRADADLMVVGLSQRISNVSSENKEQLIEENLKFISQIGSMVDLSPEVKSKAIVDAGTVAPFETWNFAIQSGLGMSPEELGVIAGGMVTKSPDEAMNAIIAQEATLPASVLVASVNQFLKGDSTRAVAWFEKNSSQLDSSNADLFRVEFAKFAAGSGEQESARMWLESVSNKAMRDEAAKSLSPK